MKNKSHIYHFFILLLIVCGCAGNENLPISAIPQFNTIDVYADKSGVTLTATLKTESDEGFNCGFYVGKDGGQAERIISECKKGTFSIILDNLKEETLYSYQAFISNGRNEIRSIADNFMTAKEFSTTITAIDAIAQETSSELTATLFSDIEDVIYAGFYYGTDPSDMNRCSATISGTKATASITGLKENTTYCYKAFVSNGTEETVSPLKNFTTLESYDFIRVVFSEEDNGSITLTAELKNTPQTATEYGFRCGTDAVTSNYYKATITDNIITVSLEGLEDDTEYIYKAYIKNSSKTTESSWCIFKTPEKENSDPGTGEDNNPETGEDNDSDQEVDPDPIVPDGNNILFKDKFVKEVCITRFDTDGDGELSYQEAAAVTDFGAFNTYYGYNELVTSFDELQYFSNLESIDCVGCTNMSSVTIPESGKLERMYFWDCRKLTSVTIPPAIRHLDQTSFSGCTGLKSVTLHDGLTELCAIAFENCTSLEEIHIPYTVAHLGEGCFAGCTSLRKFTGRYASDNGKYLADGSRFVAFAPAGYSEYTIPDGINQIGEFAFAGCTELRHVTIPENVNEIGVYAFSRCRNLERFSGRFASEDGRCLIVNGTFKALAPAGLSSYEINCSCVGVYSLIHCDLLKTVTIGKDVKRMESYIFYHCDSLSSIYMLSETPPSMDENKDIGISQHVRIMVPKNAVDTYRRADGWSRYASQIYSVQ